MPKRQLIDRCVPTNPKGPCCPNSAIVCQSGQCCLSSDDCCSTGCCDTTSKCCQNRTCCKNGFNCCPGGCYSGPCCGPSGCDVGNTCCNGKTCCTPNQTCCPKGCCLSGKGQCCGDGCCKPGETCCGNGTRCCRAEATCGKDGFCSTSVSFATPSSVIRVSCVNMPGLKLTYIDRHLVLLLRTSPRSLNNRRSQNRQSRSRVLQGYLLHPLQHVHTVREWQNGSSLQDSASQAVRYQRPRQH